MNSFDGMGFFTIFLAGKGLEKNKRNQLAFMASMTSGGNMMGLLPYIFAVKAEKKLQDAKADHAALLDKINAAAALAAAAKTGTGGTIKVGS